MALSPGTRLGVYEVTAQLGEGGMGQVYRATDTRLKRQVAIKILPPSVAADHDRLARFQREAEVLASLNHPNIAGIYGLVESEGVSGLVMELVEGDDLSQRIARGAIPIDEALPIARQIAEALEAAHEQGIIHRDLKPANVKVRADGVVKVLDFGLAKALEPVSAGCTDAATSPTITSPAMMTRIGVILGTAAYMAPEQAKGRVADKRCDVWAFGCVLYEMLEGKRVFDGADVSDTLASVLTREPDWSALPATMPPAMVTLLKRCLERDRRKRVPEMAAVRFLLDDTLAASAPSVVGPAAAGGSPHRPRLNRALPVVATALATAAATAVTAWWLVRASPAATPRPVRFSIVPPPSQSIGGASSDRIVAISPDGSHFVYVSAAGVGPSTTGALVLRALDRLDAEAIRGVTNARAPFFSPDGKWIGFFQGTEELRKVSVTGGAPITLCRVVGPSRGATWGPDDTIVFATTDPGEGLQAVPAGGGAPRSLTKPDASQREGDHFFPTFLPGGRGVLFTVTVDGENPRMAVLDLESGQRKLLVRGGSHAEYVAAPDGGPGFLLYTVTGTLHAVRFDPIRYEVMGDPVSMLEQVAMASPAYYAVSRAGALAYVPAGVAGAGVTRSIVWVDRQGREKLINAAPRAYSVLRISPDGTRLALGIGDPENDIWTWDLARQSLTKLTFDASADVAPIWTPNGRRIVFSSARGGVPNLYWLAADGTGTVGRLTTSAFSQRANAFSPDGTQLVVSELRPATASDISLLPMDGKSTPVPIIQTTSTERNAEISSDGRWIAYESTESTPSQIYVRPFPDVNSGRWLISTSGGTRPMWEPNGRELFYLDDKGVLTSVPVRATPAFTHGSPTKLFEIRYPGPGPSRSYDVSRDGQRFAVIKNISATDGEQAAAPRATLTVVLNWVEELNQRVPLK